MLETRVLELKTIISRHDGENVADRRFARTVDALVTSLFDDITGIRVLPSRPVFDLFVIRVLYVGRRSRHADVVEYLGGMLDACMQARRVYPCDARGRAHQPYYTDAISGASDDCQRPDRYETYRAYGDSALFLTGVFPSSLRPRRSRAAMMRARPASGVDHEYYVTTGKAMYRMASEQRSGEQRQRMTLARLSEGFELYADALNEISDRYITGLDRELIADRMLDSMNRARETGDERHELEAAYYSSLLDRGRESDGRG
jgi:hypothetical protein